MSEKPPRQPALPPSESSRSGSLSVSPSPQQDPELQWLEPLLQELRRGISGNTRSALTIAKAIVELRKSNDDTNRRSEEILREILIRLADLTDRIDGTVTGLKVVAEPLNEARKALNTKADELGVAVVRIEERIEEHLEEVEEQVREVTGRHATFLLEEVEEGPAPRGLKIWIHRQTDRLANFAWPHAKRAGTVGLLWLLKLLGGSTVIAALAKILSAYINGELHGGGH